MEKRVMTYLLVENEESIRETFREYAARHPELICLGVEDTVEAALEATITKRPQAVILDLQLNDSNGEDYLIRLKKLNLKETPCVVVLTNITNRITHAQVGVNGAARTICKSESGYLRDGPKYVFDVLWMKYPYFEVKYSPERPLPVPVAEETVEELRGRVREFCLERGARRNNFDTEYVAHTVAAIIKRRTKKYILKEILEEDVCPAFGGKKQHTVYVGLETCTTRMWDSGEERSLKKDYEERYNVNSQKGMPHLTELLAFIAEQL